MLLNFGNLHRFAVQLQCRAELKIEICRRICHCDLGVAATAGNLCINRIGSVKPSPHVDIGTAFAAKRIGFVG